MQAQSLPQRPGCSPLQAPSTNRLEQSTAVSFLRVLVQDYPGLPAVLNHLSQLGVWQGNPDSSTSKSKKSEAGLGPKTVAGQLGVYGVWATVGSCPLFQTSISCFFSIRSPSPNVWSSYSSTPDTTHGTAIYAYIDPLAPPRTAVLKAVRTGSPMGRVLAP